MKLVLCTTAASLAAFLALVPGCGEDGFPDDAVSEDTAEALVRPVDLTLTPIGTYATGEFDEGSAEIAAYDPATRRVFSVHTNANRLDVIDISDPTAPTLVTTLPTTGSPNSVAVHAGMVAVSSTAPTTRTDPGSVQFFESVSGMLLGAVTVGAVPDMVAFTPDGTHLLVANEGEPSDDYLVDPEGSVSIIDVSGGVAGLSQNAIRTAHFDDSVPIFRDASVRVFGPGASRAQDFEPEYLAIAPDSVTAWVTLQENNALAVLDIASARFVEVVGFGFKDHRRRGNELDASDRDAGINIQRWPVFGMYLPDAIASFRVRGTSYLVTANEGDARDYPAFAEEARVKDLVLDERWVPAAASLQADEHLGRLTVTTTLGDSDGDGRYERLFAFGGRSISVWDTDARQVWDSGSTIERLTAAALPDAFNSDNTENDSFDARSDNKGPEPEGITVATLFGRPFAFVVLERVGGIVVFDFSNPRSPRFVTYVNNRDFAATDVMQARDLGPEGVLVISERDSPNGRPLLVVSNEVSGTTTVYEIARVR